MSDQLTKEQRDFIIAQARNQGAAQSVLELLRAAGMDGDAAAAALITAAMAVLARTYSGRDRLWALNELLAPTVREWGGLVETVQ